MIGPTLRGDGESAALFLDSLSAELRVDRG